MTGIGDFEVVVGVETHVELGTRSKMFCGCPAVFGAPPNTHVCPTCLGLPGSLPVVNEAAVRLTVLIGLALSCRIVPWCRFARKNYFYPDMPKNFQISQYDEPLCVDGWVDVETVGPEGVSQVHRIGIERVHMEEDTGKSLHVGGATGRIHGASQTLVDYNRAGIPLVEIVTRPDIRSAEVARAYVTELRDILRTIGASDVRMEEGSLRCDVNTSLRLRGSAEFGTRTETKNVNSLRSVERAVRFESLRQAELLAAGERVVQETRHFHEDTATTSPGRSKEEATDYRYFPEPDLVPIATPAEEVERLRATLPELPAERRRRLAAELSLTSAEAGQLVAAGVLELVEATVAAGASPTEARSWWMNELAARAGAAGVEPADLGLAPVAVARLAELVRRGELTAALARQALDGVLAGEGDVDAVVAARGLAVVSDAGELAEAVGAALAGAPDIAEKVRGGKLAAVGPLVGAVMRATGGKAAPDVVRELILTALGVTGD
ncbi:MAG: Asp-tRNA(Asn)/Glu-tRNA(Gln) amidotransferase subunit GatB [Mycobacteriales bacterium]